MFSFRNKISFSCLSTNEWSLWQQIWLHFKFFHSLSMKSSCNHAHFHISPLLLEYWYDQLWLHNQLGVVSQTISTKMWLSCGDQEWELLDGSDTMRNGSCSHDLTNCQCKNLLSTICDSSCLSTLFSITLTILAIGRCCCRLLWRKQTAMLTKNLSLKLCIPMSCSWYRQQTLQLGAMFEIGCYILG